MEVIVSQQREDFFKKELIEELRRVEALVRQEPSIEKKIYYFSAAYGITNRTFRYSFSKEVLMADLLLNGIYNMMMERLNLVKSGNNTVSIDPITFEIICDGLRDLADGFESGTGIFESLQTITAAGYSMTGPGNYLREKGDLKF
ncbi:MAG: hypothetical protein M0Q47_01060 [Methanothrix sp.]|jgi:hypothetical protein|uniref:hypothetical protein n=1 Tax=Methanothrix sp. TaxID=90426 RepID=UPI0026007AA0|nr:hypothetical protein [Methanothrix sp.]MCK9404988.1 hypothetical protein [Methanothrix sp.]